MTPLKRAVCRGLRLGCMAAALPLPGALAAQSSAQSQAQSVKNIVLTMMSNERTAAEHKSHFAFVSRERSDRTRGQMWTERVVETTAGRVRDLLAVDGVPLTMEQAARERDRLADDAAHPERMAKRETEEQGDEEHAGQMLGLLGRGFLLENLRAEGPDWHIDFRPDEAYSPSSTEEKVLHGMVGFLLVDRKQMRLHHVEGRLPEDLSIGFGLLATIKAGSRFATTKQPMEGQWRTVRTLTDIRGKAALFKSLSRSQDVARTDFRRVPDEISVAQAVAMAENSAAP